VYNPQITIGIPSYKRETFLLKKIRNLARQRYKNLFILISCNEKPSDLTICKIQKVLKKIKHKIQIQKKNIGAWNNFLYVLKKARSPYFMWASDDDYHSPLFISTLLKLNSGKKKSCLVMSGFKNVDKQGRKYREAKQIWHYSEESVFARAKKAICDPEGFGKANFLYGIWNTKFLKIIVKGLKEHICVDQAIVLHALLDGNVKYTKNVLFKKYNHEIIRKNEKINFLCPEDGYFFSLFFDKIYKYNLRKVLGRFNNKRYFWYFYQRLYKDLSILLKQKIRKII